MYVLNAVPSGTVVIQYESIVLPHVCRHSIFAPTGDVIRVCPAILKDEKDVTATRASWHACEIHEPDVVSSVHVLMQTKNARMALCEIR